MTPESDSSLKITPLHEIHKELGAKLVPFAGWHMPIQYAGVMEEHLCVRQAVGVFDVSHMGEIDVKGPEAKAFLQYLTTNDLNKMSDGSVLYALMCYENGGVVDDLLIYRYSNEHYFLCVNASNTEKDFRWISEQAGQFKVEIADISAATAQLAVQGRNAEALLQTLSDISLSQIEYYHFKKGKIHNIECIISRTGYTGEDGFELYMDSDSAAGLFKKILADGAAQGLQPIGLGARDTLRLEMAYSLYGNEIDADCNPFEAGLGWVIRLDKEEDFIGKKTLNELKVNGPKRRIVGLKLQTRGVPRSHYKVLNQGETAGEVTSGGFSPSLNAGIALAYVDPSQAKVGNTLDIEIRNRPFPAQIVKMPFVPSSVKK
ncbi:MAG: glycine cleavage system aminomethyltransferase GcvT [Candidatus Nitrohelix vancouverensis]|uniref:Aminomethyltransferase n=1 Tax=Candidatus Nitrohelix vancouverensis TaxID=2705534 RepID=A0A7T0C016_9BACT|nr:MAG: glycine cleavage system aminomethyltransferase GcvT [Candidatus Nitrohelix vancouverensis]